MKESRQALQPKKVPKDPRRLVKQIICREPFFCQGTNPSAAVCRPDAAGGENGTGCTAGLALSAPCLLVHNTGGTV